MLIEVNDDALSLVSSLSFDKFSMQTETNNMQILENSVICNFIGRFVHKTAAIKAAIEMII